MTTCFYCKQQVGSYGWDSEGRIKCVSCENWEHRLEALKRDKSLVAFKGLMEGQRVLVKKRNFLGGGFEFVIGRIVRVDKRENIEGRFEHYLIEFCVRRGWEYLGNQVEWVYPENVKPIPENSPSFVCKSCDFEKREKDRFDENICVSCAEKEKQGLYSCWYCHRKFVEGIMDKENHKCSFCYRREKEEEEKLCLNK